MPQMSSFATFRWLGWVVLASIALTVGLSLVTDFNPFALRNIEIHGALNTEKEFLLESLGLAKGQSFFWNDVAEMTRKAKALPWVKEAKIARRIPDTVIIDIEEWEPAFIVRLDRFYYMTKDGHVINAPLSKGMDFTIVTGMTWQRLLGSGADRSKLVEALELVAKGAPGDRVDEVHYDQALGLTIYAYGQKPYQAFLGFGDIDDKFERLAWMRKALHKKGQYAASADLSAKDKIVARLLPLQPPGEQGGVK